MSQVQFIQVTPEQLQNAIVEGINSKLDELKNHLQPKEPNEYLTRQEVADLFNISLSTIHNHVKSGRLKPHYLGRRTYFKRQEVENNLLTSNS